MHELITRLKEERKRGREGKGVDPGGRSDSTKKE